MEQLIKPFDNIGIAFTGGGFRAAAFALGTLSYLHHLDLDQIPPLSPKTLHNAHNPLPTNRRITYNTLSYIS
jgi:hypothetical protein